MIRSILYPLLLLLSFCAAATARTPLTKDFPAVLEEQMLISWSFKEAAEKWPALNQSRVEVSNGMLQIEGTGDDANVRIPIPPTEGPLVIRWKMRTSVQGPAELYWASTEHPDMGKNGSIRISGVNDGKWHDCEVTVPASDKITTLRFDPATKPGLTEVVDASVVTRRLHPLQFEQLTASSEAVKGFIRNTLSRPLAVLVNGSSLTLEAKGRADFHLQIPSGKAFHAYRLQATTDGFPPLERTLYLHDPTAMIDSADFGNRNVLVQKSRDGSGVRLLWKGQLAAIVSPLPSGCEIRVEGDDVIFEAAKTAEPEEINVRVVGEMKQGLLSGVEYLGAGEESSSAIDLERPEHLRFEPEKRWVTVPLAGYVTSKATVALLWDNMGLQPLFSTPNRYDLTGDHLMGLRGARLSCRVHLGDGINQGGGLDDAIVWAVKRRGLPELPQPSRTADQQRALNLSAMNGPLRTAKGWYHATWEGQPQHFFADHASTMFLLTGEVPQLPALVPNGAHVPNPAAWLLTGRAKEWMQQVRAEVTNVMREQKPDGSFRYKGKFQRGHFEDTASGYCAIEALKLLDGARFTGEKAFTEAALRALDYMKRFDVPRGAQTWEIPLHTPDILAAAKCCMAYLRGYELTDRADYLELARRWAIRGLPFLYLWDDKPVMRYGSVAVLGATDWTGVVWIGLPVQWCGSVYAYALTELAKHDSSLDWKQIAEGILITAEQMQYPDGEFAGTLPDSFNLGDQRRLPAYVNPCVLVALREKLAGRNDSVSVAANSQFRVVAPFPVRIQNEQALVQGKAGVSYQIIVNGTQIVGVESRGEDVIRLRN